MDASPSCPSCGKPVPTDLARCPFDGTELPRTEAAEPERPDGLIGQSLGDYVISERLGRGGMGIVYAGEQPLIGKKVAIKVLRPEVARDEKQVSRLLAEARSVNAIRHRGIIDIFNFGRLSDGRHYVVMELLSGEALDVLLLRRGTLPALEVIAILDEVLAALGAGHGVGIVHRDLKPSNIFLVSEANGSKYVKLLDYGLAKQTESGAKPLTQANLVVGTPEYMSPEQARAEKVSPQSDLYSAGIIAFELLTGRLPFEAPSPFEFMVHQVQTRPPAPSTFVQGIPPELERLVLQLLEKDPANRPANAEVVRAELQRIRAVFSAPAPVALGEDEVSPTTADASAIKGEQPEPEPAVIRAEEPARASRSPWPWVALGALVVCAVIGGLVLWRGSGPEVKTQTDARRDELPAPTPAVVQPEVKEEPTPDAGVAAEAPAEKPPAVKPDSAPSRASLLAEVTRLEKRVKTSPRKLKISAASAKATLKKLRASAQSAKSGAERTRTSSAIRDAERRMFGK